MARELSPADSAFHDQVRPFLDAELTPALRQAGRRTAGIFIDHDHGQAWFRILADKCWSVSHWPVEWGGCGWWPRQAYLFSSELGVQERGGTYTPLLRARLARLQSAWRQACADRPTDDDERRDRARALADAECRIRRLARAGAAGAGRRHPRRGRARRAVDGQAAGYRAQAVLHRGRRYWPGPTALPAWRWPIADCAAHALAMPEDAVFAMSTDLNDRAASVYAGTNEVQRNLIAQHLLAN